MSCPPNDGCTAIADAHPTDAYEAPACLLRASAALEHACTVADLDTGARHRSLRQVARHRHLSSPTKPDSTRRP